MHNGQIRFKQTIPVHRKILRHTALALAYIEKTFFLGEVLINKLRQAGRGVSAENNVHKGIALAEFFCNMLLLNHTAANCDYHIRIFVMGFL